MGSVPNGWVSPHVFRYRDPRGRRAARRRVRRVGRQELRPWMAELKPGKWELTAEGAEERRVVGRGWVVGIFFWLGIDIQEQ